MFTQPDRLPLPTILPRDKKVSYDVIRPLLEDMADSFTGLSARWAVVQAAVEAADGGFGGTGGERGRAGMAKSGGVVAAKATSLAREIGDALNITALRAEQVWATYDAVALHDKDQAVAAAAAVVAVGETVGVGTTSSSAAAAAAAAAHGGGVPAKVSTTPPLSTAPTAQSRLQDSLDAVNRAVEVVRRREAEYRVPLDWVAGWRPHDTKATPSVTAYVLLVLGGCWFKVWGGVAGTWLGYTVYVGTK
jgi:hypothetical protein